MTKHDLGLHAVSRVRAAHEEQARHDLQLAVADLNRYLHHKAQLSSHLAATDGVIEGPIEAVLASRASVTRLIDAIRYTTDQIAVAETVVDARRGDWEKHKTDLEAVERLLQNREARRKVERARKEARELDDVAARGWIRQQAVSA